jgi:hypothetical protein
LRGVNVRVIAIALLVPLAACGASEKEKVEQTVKDYSKAEATGDVEKACDLRVFEAGDDCEAIITQISRSPNMQDRTRILTDADYEVTVDGDKAHATAQNVGSFDLERFDGDWKIVNVPLSGPDDGGDPP